MVRFGFCRPFDRREGGQPMVLEKARNLRTDFLNAGRAGVGPALRLAASILALLSCGACSYLRSTESYGAGAAAVRDLAPIQRKLQTADAASAHVLLTDIGRITYPEFEAPVWYVAYRPFQPALKRVLVLSGVHGDAAAGVDYLVGFVSKRAEPTGAAGCDMDIIPIVNPWGYVHDLPLNRNGMEIGRDFANFDSHEARVIRRFLREKRYDLVIDLREDPDAEGFCIWQYGLPDETVSAAIVRRVQAEGHPIENDTSLVLLKPRDGVVAAPMWGLTFLRLFRELTLAGYVRRNLSDVVFTVVTPSQRPLAERIAMQRIAVEMLLDEYGQTR
jgi:hypothetical protein